MEICYTIKKLPEGLEKPFGEVGFRPIDIPPMWQALDEARIIHYPWKAQDGDYMPECAARVGWNEEGLHVLMYALEPEIRAMETRTGGNVYLDSCMEFFLAPDSRSLCFVNFEINPLATMYISVGEGRTGRDILSVLPEGFNPCASKHNGMWWAVTYTIPSEFLSARFAFRLCSGTIVRGNFYNCGDPQRHPHHGLFYPYNLPKPDYYRADLFAKMVLE